jgi:hypothetical protein
MKKRLFILGTLTALLFTGIAVAQVIHGAWPASEYGRFVGPGSLLHQTAHTTTNAGTTAISFTIAPARDFELIGIRATVTEDGAVEALTSSLLTAKLDAFLGSAYDHTIFSEDLSIVGTGIMIIYDPPIPILASDELDISFDDTGSSDDDMVGVEVMYRYIGAAP